MSNDPNPYAPPATPTSPGPTSEGDVSQASPEYAGFGVRAGARIIDIIVVTVLGTAGGFVGGVVAGVLAASGQLPPGWMQRIGGLTAASFALGALAGILYHMLSEGLGGASVGKALLGLRVRREDLRPCGVGAALVRNLAYYIDAFFFGLVAYSSMSKSAEQQRLGDKWGHTVVVRSATLPDDARGGLGLGLVLGMAAHVVVSGVSIVIRAF